MEVSENLALEILKLGRKVFRGIRLSSFPLPQHGPCSREMAELEEAKTQKNCVSPLGR
jgi:hypothetical protein